MNVVDRLRAGEESALVELMQLYGDYLTRTAYLLVKDRQLSEELVQDTYVLAYKRIDQLHDNDKIKSWLTSIIMNLARSHMRKWSFKNVLLTFDSTPLMSKGSPTDELEQKLLNVMDNKLIYKEIQNLSYKYKEIIVLFYYNELKTNEIAELLKMKENTVKSRLKRGRVLLKENLLKGGYEHG
ncbi:sigma-70 family RNA polymerase sigma factor [Sutcliffiella sp. NC1]|uniref:RNA polymerase sigma factor n=1 Tax=Sutcliffiella cohnii TaxID=33932 RepID=A0A223KKH8_9BACI|nr:MULTISPECIES: sigma-70 family RNA polymerase sigma factor [Sutcliffiella]AST89863.1 RNA polymerase [Sutcliffiella cohnii]WBL17471.1 sigma-70 family RNA polymerase sigma factor [Sutcliffiella sp. NC1]